LYAGPVVAFLCRHSAFKGEIAPVQLCGNMSICPVVVIYFVAALQHLDVLLGVIIRIISVQFASKQDYLSHCCSVLSEIWPVCP
jgi:hypothetical protein